MSRLKKESENTKRKEKKPRTRSLGKIESGKGTRRQAGRHFVRSPHLRAMGCIYAIQEQEQKRWTRMLLLCYAMSILSIEEVV
jgi:hypothetical protein